MKSRLGLFSGIGLAALGVGGLASGGIAWNFKGRPIGLGTTVASLVVIGISLVILRPQPSEPVMEPEGFDPVSTGISLKRPQISVLGALLATSGTLGLAASGIAWNFKGIEIGLTGTLTSLLALAFSVLFLWPAGNKKQAQPAPSPVESKPVDEPAAVLEQPESDPSPQLTTAEVILKELAEQQEKAPDVALTTFAPENLVPGQGLNIRNRKAGPSLGRYRRMADDLFRN